MNNNLVKELKRIVGDGNFSTSSADLKAYAHTPAPGTDFLTVIPDMVVLPQTVEQVSEIVQLANETKTPVVPRGAGTSFAGMNIAHKGGIMLDMSLMNRLLEIDEANMVVVAEGGCSVYKIMYELDKRKLQFPFLPIYTSAPQIGAGVATNCTGLFMTKFGSIGDNITGLEVVLPTGEIVKFGSCAYGESHGFFYRYIGMADLIGLFVNSGGTMGVITKVAVRIKPKPNAVETLSYGWVRHQATNLAKAMYQLQRDFIYDIWLTNYWNFLPFKKISIPPDVHFIAFLSIDALSEEELTFQRKRVLRICQECEGVDLGDLGKSFVNPPYYRLWEFRALWRGYTTYFYSPIMKFPEVYELFESTCRKYGFWDEKHLPTWFSFHGRNTINPYPMLGHTNAADPEESAKLKDWWNEINLELVKMGCVQYLIGDFFPAENYQALGPLYQLLKKLKTTLDPNNIMNPSKVYGGI